MPRRVISLSSYGHVRQKGALSSFNIPAKPVGHRDWKIRYGKVRFSEYRFRLQRDERVVLEEHARKCGCSLIIDPTLHFRKLGVGARKARLNELLQFLKSMPDRLVRVAINRRMPRNSHVLIVGNWSLAESITAALGRGYMQTIFTRYAPVDPDETGPFRAGINRAVELPAWRPCRIPGGMPSKPFRTLSGPCQPWR